MREKLRRYLGYLADPLVIGLILTVVVLVAVAADDGVWAASGHSPLNQTVPPRGPTPSEPDPEPPTAGPGSSQEDSGQSEGSPIPLMEDAPLQIPGPGEPTATDTPESGQFSVAGSRSASATLVSSVGPASSGEVTGQPGSQSVAVLQGNTPLTFRTPVSPSYRESQQDSEAADNSEMTYGQYGVRTWLSSFYLLPIGSFVFVVVGAFLVVNSRSGRT